MNVCMFFRVLCISHLMMCRAIQTPSLQVRLALDAVTLYSSATHHSFLHIKSGLFFKSGRYVLFIWIYLFFGTVAKKSVQLTIHCKYSSKVIVRNFWLEGFYLYRGFSA